MKAPAPMMIRRCRRRLRREAARVGRVLFAQQADEAAEGQDVDRVLRLAALDAEEARRVADAELQHLDAEQLRRDEVSQLVDDDERARGCRRTGRTLCEHVRSSSEPRSMPSANGGPRRLLRGRPQARCRQSATWLLQCVGKQAGNIEEAQAAVQECVDRLFVGGGERGRVGAALAPAASAKPRQG